MRFIYRNEKQYNHIEGFSSELFKPDCILQKGRFNLLPYITFNKDSLNDDFYFSWLFLKIWKLELPFDPPKLTITYNNYIVFHTTIFQKRIVFKFKLWRSK